MENNYNDEVLAAISAAIASYTAGSSIKLVVKSIRRTGATSPAWNMAGRTENISDTLI